MMMHHFSEISTVLRNFAKTVSIMDMLVVVLAVAIHNLWTISETRFLTETSLEEEGAAYITASSHLSN